jgi:hypothetical protein
MKLLPALLVFALLGAAPSSPALTLPQNWTLQPRSATDSANFVGEWRRTPKPVEKYPTRVLYYAFSPSKETYAQAVDNWRKIVTCPTGSDAMIARMANICGFVVDRDEKCGSMPVHRFVRLANLGPPELVAQTELYVPLTGGFYEITYERPASEFAADGTGERYDDVLNDIQSWCDAVAASEGYVSTAPSAAPTSAPLTNARMATFALPKGWVRVQNDGAVMVWRATDSITSIDDIRLAKTAADPSFQGAGAVQKVKQIMQAFPYSVTVEPIRVCDGKQPAIHAVGKDSQGRTVMEQVIVEGSRTGAILTYEVPDGVPDPAAENAINSICWP